MRGPSGTRSPEDAGPAAAPHGPAALGVVQATALEVRVPHAVPPGARLHPMLTVYLPDGDVVDRAAPGLRVLFTLLDDVGAVEFSRRAVVDAWWTVPQGPGQPVRLTLDVRKPVEAAGTVHVLVGADSYAQAWPLIADGGLVALTTRGRLPSTADASMYAAFAASIAVRCAPPPQLMRSGAGRSAMSAATAAHSGAVPT